MESEMDSSMLRANYADAVRERDAAITARDSVRLQLASLFLQHNAHIKAMRRAIIALIDNKPLSALVLLRAALEKAPPQERETAPAEPGEDGAQTWTKEELVARRFEILERNEMPMEDFRHLARAQRLTPEQRDDYESLVMIEILLGMEILKAE